jgi:hypothetical protein
MRTEPEIRTETEVGMRMRMEAMMWVFQEFIQVCEQITM